MTIGLAETLGTMPRPIRSTRSRDPSSCGDIPNRPQRFPWGRMLMQSFPRVHISFYFIFAIAIFTRLEDTRIYQERGK
jgi:hypothetical protein